MLSCFIRISPSIFLQLFKFRVAAGVGGVGAYPTCYRVHPGLSHLHPDQLSSMSGLFGEAGENPLIHREYKLHTERPQPTGRFKLKSFFL